MIRDKTVFTCLVIALLVLAFPATAQAGKGTKVKGPSCNPGGLWFGFVFGQPPFKVGSIIPIDGGKKRYIIAAEDQDPTVTPFRGEMVRINKNVYKLWGMQYTEIATDTYGYIVISGEWYFTDCDNGVGEYLVTVYDLDPFHDTSAEIIMGPFPIVNTYERMPMVDDSSSF